MAAQLTDATKQAFSFVSSVGHNSDLSLPYLTSTNCCDLILLFQSFALLSETVTKNSTTPASGPTTATSGAGSSGQGANEPPPLEVYKQHAAAGWSALTTQAVGFWSK